MTDLHTAAKQDIPDLIAGALGVSRGTAYDLMREALAEQPAPVQHFDHTAAANAALRNAQDRSTAIAKTLVKRPQNCGTSYCSCIECVMETARQEPVATLWQHGRTGRTRITMPGDITDCDADWFKAADLYTSPPAQRKPLDAGEISRLWKQHTSEDGPHHNPYDDDGLGFARAIEAAHSVKEKIND